MNDLGVRWLLDALLAEAERMHGPITDLRAKRSEFCVSISGDSSELAFQDSFGESTFASLFTPTNDIAEACAAWAQAANERKGGERALAPSQDGVPELGQLIDVLTEELLRAKGRGFHSFGVSVSGQLGTCRRLSVSVSTTPMSGIGFPYLSVASLRFVSAELRNHMVEEVHRIVRARGLDKPYFTEHYGILQPQAENQPETDAELSALLETQLAVARASLPWPLIRLSLYCGDPERTQTGVCISKATFRRPDGQNVEVALMCHEKKGRQFDRAVAKKIMACIRRAAAEHDVDCHRSDGMYY